MFFCCFKIKKYIIFILICIILCTLVTFFSLSRLSIDAASDSIIWENNISSSSEKDYIKWVDFNVSYDALEKTSKLDIDSHTQNNSTLYNWVELLSYLACKYGGDFKKFNNNDLIKLKSELDTGKTMEYLTRNLKNYDYYYEAYNAILCEFIGEYQIKDNNKEYKSKYGVKAFLPIAKNYSFNHYSDFGNSRNYGYKRVHLGNDLMGSIGTPIVAVESGKVEALGWNQYGGWRIGIRSFDGKRYYYYAHLRKDHPYAKDLEVGQIVTAGDVIGYLGMTGYSTKENVNNINVPHLHFGMQLIFDESQKDGTNQIWIDVYQIIEFLRKNKSEVYRNVEEKEFYRKYNIIDPIIPL